MGESGIRRCLKLGAVGSCETAFSGAATVYVNGCQGEGGRPKLTYTEGAVGASALRCSRREFLQGSLALAGLGLISACGVLPPQARPPASGMVQRSPTAASPQGDPSAQEGLAIRASPGGGELLKVWPNGR